MSCRSFIADRECFIEIDSRGEAAALFGKARPRMIDENPAHHRAHDGEEVRAIVKGDRLGIHQPHEGFVHERGGLKGVAGAFARHVTARDLVHLAMNQRHQLMKRRLIAFAPSNE